MTKMSNPQANLILAAHNRPAKVTPYGARGEIVLSSRLYFSGEVLLRNGWAIRNNHGWLNVTPAGLVAAGVDMDALHAEALDMHEAFAAPANCGTQSNGDWRCTPWDCDKPAECVLPDAEVDYNLPMGADPALVYGERTPAPVGVVTPERRAEIRRVVDATVSGPAPTLADDVAALRSMIAETWNLNNFREELLEHIDRIAGAAPQRATEADVVRCARRWYYEHGYAPGYLPCHVLGSDRDLKLAVEALRDGA